MGKDLNKVIFTGRLGSDPESRQAGASNVTSFRVASNRTFVTNGEKKEQTEWFSVVAWGKLADVCSQYLTKGTRVLIEGRLETRSWEDKTSGEVKYKTEVIANELVILSGSGERGDAPDEEGEAERPAPARTFTPPTQRGTAGSAMAARTAAAVNRPPAPKGKFVEEDELPF